MVPGIGQEEEFPRLGDIRRPAWADAAGVDAADNFLKQAEKDNTDFCNEQTFRRIIWSNWRKEFLETYREDVFLIDEMEPPYEEEETIPPVKPPRDEGGMSVCEPAASLTKEEKLQIILDLQKQIQGKYPGNMYNDWAAVMAGIQDGNEVLAGPQWVWEPGNTLADYVLLAKAVQYESKPEPEKLPLQARMETLKMGSQLSITQKADLRDLLLTKDHAFAWNLQELGITKAGEDRIPTGDARPIKQRPYRFSPQENEVVRQEIDKMLGAGIIRKSKSPWASPVLVVPKPDGSPRFCIDYRRLNSITKKDVYPLPRIDEALDTLGGALYFSALDLKAGYWQIPLSDSDAEKTAFITKFGLFEFTRLPFGLCGAPAIFQRLMDETLGDLLWKTVIVYLDDIIIFTATFEEHLTVLAEVIDLLFDAGLRVSPTKSDFCFSELLYLGHVVSGKTVKPNPKKVSAVAAVPTPSCVKDVRSFLGLASYYRRFIQNFARIATPLTRLLKKTAVWCWSDDCDRAFRTLKAALTCAPIVRAPDFSKLFVVLTDWSKEAIGAILG